MSPGKAFEIDLVQMPKDPTTRYQYLINLVDLYNNKSYTCQLQTKTADKVADAIKKVINDNKLDKIKVVYSDPGSEFNNNAFKKMLSTKGIVYRAKPTARKNNTAKVEYVNGIYTKHLMSKQTLNEMKTKKVNRYWTSDQKKLNNVYNKHIDDNFKHQSTEKLLKPFKGPMPKLKEGDKVHVRVEQKAYRHGDL